MECSPEYSGASEITLYRLPINRVAVDRHHLRRAIHDTLLHELGHLFGMTETDLDHYSIGNNPAPGRPTRARSARRRAGRERVQDTGIVFSGSMNGIGTTVAVRDPHSDSTSSRVPVAASSVGTQA